MSPSFKQKQAPPISTSLSDAAKLKAHKSLSFVSDPAFRQRLNAGQGGRKILIGYGVALLIIATVSTVARSRDWLSRIWLIAASCGTAYVALGITSIYLFKLCDHVDRRSGRFAIIILAALHLSFCLGFLKVL